MEVARDALPEEVGARIASQELAAGLEGLGDVEPAEQCSLVWATCSCMLAAAAAALASHFDDTYRLH